MALMTPGSCLIRLRPDALHEPIQTMTCPHCQKRKPLLPTELKLTKKGSTSISVGMDLVDVELGETRSSKHVLLRVALCRACRAKGRWLNVAYKLFGVLWLVGPILLFLAWMPFAEGKMTAALLLGVPGALATGLLLPSYVIADRSWLRVVQATPDLVVIRAPKSWQAVLEDEAPDVLG